MFRQSRYPLLASAVAAAIAGTAIANAKPSQEVVEARQESQIWTTYALSPYLRANDLKVSVHEGKATLSGHVAEGVNKDLARQIALGVDGIKTVDNLIEVVPDYKAPAQSADRSYGEMVDDASITSEVKSKLYGAAISTHSPWTSRRRGARSSSRATRTAWKRRKSRASCAEHRGVRAVNNQLAVATAKPATAKTSANPEGTDVADGWITTKVKSTFMYSSNVNGSDIAVSTNSGVVTLTGKMDTGAERALAIELARNVRGVKSVDSNLLTM